MCGDISTPSPPAPRTTPIQLFISLFARYGRLRITEIPRPKNQKSKSRMDYDKNTPGHLIGRHADSKPNSLVQLRARCFLFYLFSRPFVSIFTNVSAVAERDSLLTVSPRRWVYVEQNTTKVWGREEPGGPRKDDQIR